MRLGRGPDTVGRMQLWDDKLAEVERDQPPQMPFAETVGISCSDVIQPAV